MGCRFSGSFGLSISMEIHFSVYPDFMQLVKVEVRRGNLVRLWEDIRGVLFLIVSFTLLAVF